MLPPNVDPKWADTISSMTHRDADDRASADAAREMLLARERELDATLPARDQDANGGSHLF